MSLGFDFYGNLGLGTTQSSRSIFTTTANTTVSSTAGVQSSLGYNMDTASTVIKNTNLETIIEDVRNFFTLLFLNNDLNSLKNSFSSNVSTILDTSTYIKNILNDTEKEKLKSSQLTIQQFFVSKLNEIANKYEDDNDIYTNLIFDILNIIEQSYYRENEIIYLNTKIENLNTQIDNIYKPKFGMANIVTEVKTDVVINIAYIQYIEKYGVPENGIFDTQKLSEFL